MSNNVTCSCGGGDGPYHPIGEGNCLREIARGKLVPTNFRKDNGIDVCDVNGYTITVYTLTDQRLYSKHPEGVWSLPKDHSSVNSIQMND